MRVSAHRLHFPGFIPLLVLLALLCSGQCTLAPPPTSASFVRNFTYHPTSVNAVAVNPFNASEFMSGGSDGLLVFWHTETGQVLRTTQVPEMIYAVAYSPKVADRVAVGLASGSLNIYTFCPCGQTMRMTLSAGTSAINTVVFDPTDGDLAITASSSGFVAVWNVSAALLLRNISAHANQPVYGAALSPFTPGEALSGAFDKLGMRHAANATMTVLTSYSNHTGGVYTINYNPANPDEVITGSVDKRAVLFDRATGAVTRVFVGHTSSVYVALFNPNNSSEVVTGSLDNTVRFWNKATGVIAIAFFYYYSGSVSRILTGHTNAIRDMAFIPSRDQIITASDDGLLKLWNCNSTTTTQAVSQATTTPVPSPARNNNSNATAPPTPQPPPAPTPAAPSGTSKDKTGLSRTGVIAIAAGGTAALAIGGCVAWKLCVSAATDAAEVAFEGDEEEGKDGETAHAKEGDDEMGPSSEPDSEEVRSGMSGTPGSEL